MKKQYQALRESFRLRQQTVTLPSLARAGDYLLSKQLDAGWPLMEGLPFELHSTALAIEALSHFSDDRFRVAAGKGSVFLMRERRGHFQEADLDQLSDLLIVATCEQTPDADYVNEILSAYEDTADARKGSELPLRTICSSLIALSTVGAKRASFYSSWVDALRSAQSKSDGSWPAASGGLPSIVSTALAVRVFARLDGRSEATEHLGRGVDYLIQLLGRGGWQSLGSSGDTFTRALVLRALAEAPRVPYDVIAEGIEALSVAVNADGGWGGAAGEPSSVESTSLAVLALVSAGETRFIPLRMAEAAMTQAEEVLSAATSERDQLRADFNREVERRSGQILQEMRDLRKQNQELRSTSQELENATREAEQRFIRLSYGSGIGYREGVFSILANFLVENPSRLLFLTLALGVSGMLQAVGKFYHSIPRYVSWISLGIEVMVLSWLVVYLFLAWRDATNSRLRRLRSPRIPVWAGGDEQWGMGLSEPIEYFMRVNAQLPRSASDELLYRISTDFPEMPPDLARRYGRDVALRLGLAPEDAAAVQSWLERMSVFPPTERRLILDSIRRALRR